MTHLQNSRVHPLECSSAQVLELHCVLCTLPFRTHSAAALLLVLPLQCLSAAAAAAAATYKDTLHCSTRRRNATQCLLAGSRGSLDSGGLPQLVVWNTLKSRWRVKGVPPGTLLAHLWTWT